MMTGNLKSLIFLALSIVVLLTTGFAFIGEAFSPASLERGGHALSDISGYNIQIDIKIDQKNPERVAAILLEVSAPNGSDTADSVHISLNGGDTWVQCSFEWGRSWRCDFRPDSEPRVVDTENLQISAQGIRKVSGFIPAKPLTPGTLYKGTRRM